MIEHVANHQHAAGAPLAHAAQLRMIELCHATTPVTQGVGHRTSGVGAEAVTLGNLRDAI
jgi:hypothetical protein